jgi:CRP-like cAMP-binding protein
MMFMLRSTLACLGKQILFRPRNVVGKFTNLPNTNACGVINFSALWDMPELRGKAQGMCGVLDSAELVALSRHTRLVRHSVGEELAAESMPIESYANVMRGVVKLTKVLEDGRQQIVGLQFAPDFLGRLFAPDSAVTAEAASDVDLCRVTKGGLERLIAENPKLEHRLMQQTLRELDEAR